MDSDRRLCRQEPPCRVASAGCGSRAAGTQPRGGSGGAAAGACGPQSRRGPGWLGWWGDPRLLWTVLSFLSLPRFWGPAPVSRGRAGRSRAQPEIWPRAVRPHGGAPFLSWQGGGLVGLQWPWRGDFRADTSVSERCVFLGFSKGLKKVASLSPYLFPKAGVFFIFVVANMKWRNGTVSPQTAGCLPTRPLCRGKPAAARICVA